MKSEGTKTKIQNIKDENLENGFFFLTSVTAIPKTKPKKRKKKKKDNICRVQVLQIQIPSYCSYLYILILLY